jgi:hypothetical protein
MSDIEKRINEVEERFLSLIGRLRMDYDTKINDYESKIKDYESKINDMNRRSLEIEENLKLLNDVCLEPVIRNTAVKILNDLFPTIPVPIPSSKWYNPLSSKIGNRVVYPLYSSTRFQDMEKPLKINDEDINCEMVDIDELIDNDNSKRHLDEMVREINNIKKGNVKFSVNLDLPLSIIEKSMKHCKI